jgi:hypothetical protein
MATTGAGDRSLFAFACLSHADVEVPILVAKNWPEVAVKLRQRWVVGAVEKSGCL